VFHYIAVIVERLYAFTGSYFWTITGITLLFMVLLTPLTVKGTRSMLAMQRLQPEIKRLQAEHKGDRQALSEATMKMYQEHKVNPVGGCLPLLIQGPIFFVLYRVLVNLTRKCNDNAQIADGACRKLGNFRPGYISKTSELFNDLANASKMRSLSLDLSRSAVQTASESFVRALPYLALALLIFATNWYQQRQMSARTTSAVVNPQQQMIMKIMPFAVSIFAFVVPAAMGVYLLVSNLYRVGQNAFITRRYFSDKPTGVIEASSEEVTTKAKVKRPEPTGPVLPPAAKKAQAIAAKNSGVKAAPPKGNAKAPGKVLPKPKPAAPTRPGKKR
jgi:YidC/Oxa1 family membrane protein insertase